MQKNLSLIRGDTLAFTFEVEGLTDSLNSCYFSCKKNIDDLDYVFQKSLDNGITKEDNKYKVRIAPEDTKTKPIGDYLYDLQIGIGADIYTVMTGSLTIKKEITGEPYE